MNTYIELEMSTSNTWILWLKINNCHTLIHIPEYNAYHLLKTVKKVNWLSIEEIAGVDTAYRFQIK